ncbi:MAG: tetratricopeptide repeat protein [Myxococcales bacterium]|nr:tetratricopeptide repeat protein [Myxococcales bacterium]
MSDNEKDRPTPPGGMPAMFTNRPAAARDAIPTADEGDALLDMLFDDAIKAPSAEPSMDLGATVVSPPANELLGAARHPRRTPTPPTPLPGGEDEVTAFVRPEDPPTRVYSAPPPDFDDDDEPLLVSEPPPAAPPGPPPRPARPAPPEPPPTPPRQPSYDSVASVDLEEDDRTIIAAPVDEAPAPATVLGVGPQGHERPLSTIDLDEEEESTFGRLDPGALLSDNQEPDASVELSDEATTTFARPEAPQPVALLDDLPLEAAADSAPPLLKSTRPPLPPVALEDERDAAAVLAATPGARDSFLERASWMVEEARLRQDKVQRARLLLTASELYAIAGEDDSAAQVAQEAYQLAPNMPLVIRQHRALVARTAGWQGALDLLDTEVRHMPTAEGRAHAAWLGAEVARIALDDAAGAKKRVDQALRAAPADPRPCVQRFTEALASGADAAALAKIKPSDPQALASLGAAFAQVGAFRAPDASHDPTRGPRHPFESFLAARAALSAGNRAGLLTSLGQLRQTSFGPAAGWLGHAVASARPDTRNEAIAALRTAATGTDPAAARRALAGISIEMGESVDFRDREAFGPADRIALAALDAARPGPAGMAAREALAPLLDEAAADSGASEAAADVAILASATVAAVLPLGDHRLTRLRYATVGSPDSSAATQLGRVLAAAKADADSVTTLDGALTEVTQHIDASKPERTALLRALSLELDIAGKATERVAQTIATWGASLDGSTGSDTTGMLAAALLAEISGDVDRARQVYAEIHRDEPVHEVTARASAGLGDPIVLAKLLKDHADTLPSGIGKALLLTECAIRYASLALGQEETSEDAGAFTAEAEACARAAAELAPQLPVAVHLGEISARARADQSALVDWLRFRREASDDPVERAHDLTREALLMSDGESNAAGTLLEEALRARPADVGLRDLYERLSGEAPADRATWREAQAIATQSTMPAEAARLALEAALEYERAGDLEAASRTARLAEACGDRLLAPIAQNRFALAGFGTAELVDALLPQARETEDAGLRHEIYERLAELDERGRGDTASGLLFRRTILEENPGHIHTLRRVASALMAESREEEMEPIALELAKALDGGEAVAYAALSARLRQRISWEETAEPVRVAYAREPRAIWVLRQMAAHARSAGDLKLAAECDMQLATRTDRSLERATLALRSAEALRVAGDIAGAQAQLEEAVSIEPRHFMIRLALATVLEELGPGERSRAAEIAEHLEAAAYLMQTPAWRAETNYRAACVYQDVLQDLERARVALERVWEAEPDYADTFERLRRLYVATNARGELAELLERRLGAIQDPAERVEMEVMRGQALAEVGDAAAAKRALAAALDANPDHLEALSAFAQLCFGDGDYEGAEQALIRLARHTADADQQVAIYFRLGELYDQLLPNDERAELAYQEILKRRPQDEGAREKLIGLFRRTGQLARAVDEQNVLVNAAESPDEKCRRTVELAELLEEQGELKKAESTLVVARKSFPKSDLALRAIVKFYQRTGQGPAAAVLLDRAVADARRALGTGRFESFLFETLATAAELRDRAEAAAAARATVAAIDGLEADVGGVGPRAGDAKLDELLAPEVMTPSFRELLLRTGPMLDAAFPYELDAIRAAPLPPPLAAVGEEVRAIAGAYGLHQIQVLVSTVLGPVCIPARANPPTIVLGQVLASQPPCPERTFLLHRAMKVLQSGTAVLARTAPIDLWPLVAAYLKVFSPTFAPQGVDAARFNDSYGRLSRALPQGLSPDVGVLAADVIGNIGNRASTLNAAVNGWGSRAGLLAVGDPNVALTGIAWAGGNANGPPPAGKERLTWIGRNAEARDIVIFSVSDAYVEARSRAS